METCDKCIACNCDYKWPAPTEEGHPYLKKLCDDCLAEAYKVFKENEQKAIVQ